MLSPMTRILGYHIDEVLVLGTRSSVYRGTRVSDNAPVILKVVDSQRATLKNVARLKHEYEIIKLLKHDALIKAYGLEKHDHLLMLVLEDIGGISLFRYLKDRAISTWQALEIYIKAARQLGIIHGFQVVHKDINPTNIVLNPKTGDVRITDFSISTQLARENPYHLDDHFEGTLAYISPEQTGRMNRDLDYRSDFYSLGMSLYETLARRLPFTPREPMELIHCHLARVPVNPSMFNSEIPGMISEIVLKLISKNAEDRYQSSKGIIYDLQKCLNAYKSMGHVEYFPPGEHDTNMKLSLPQKIYGRDGECSQLLELYEKVKGGSVEVLILSGGSGTGKNALINELHKPMAKQRSYFISGRSDLYQRNIPYASLIQAFGKLARKILAESNTRLNYWKKRILKCLGANTRIITEVIPEVEHIVGEQEPVASLPPGESENRFSLVFRRFVGAFAIPEHPLVIFLDDLQWADTATLKLLEMIVQDHEIKSLLLICSYLDDEVSEAHPIMETMDILRDSSTSVSHFHLGPLPSQVVGNMVADALRMDIEAVDTLSQIVFEKTGGNPFHIGEYLKQLSEEQLLYYDVDRQGWRWDAVKIAGADLGEDAVDIFIERIRKLDDPSQKVLKNGACIGNVFSVAQLARVCELKPGETVKLLWPAVEKGLIHSQDAVSLMGEDDVSFNEHYFEFNHDQIQMACYALTTESDRQRIHLKIGRALASGLDEPGVDENLFEIVNQYNLGIALVEDGDERDRLLKMNLRAGEKALTSVAYQPANGYFSNGMSLLPESCWISHYEIALRLHLKRGECEFLLGNNQLAEKFFEEALARSETVPEMAFVFNMRTVLYTHRGLYFEAIEAGLAGLDLLEISLPVMDDQLEIQMQELLLQIKEGVGDRTHDQLLECPEMEDPIQRAGMVLLGHIWAPAMNMNRNLMNLVVLKIVEISLKYGNTSISSCGYVGYGLILGSLLGNYKRGDEYGKLALSLSDRYPNPEFASQVRFMFGAFVHPWRYHFRSCLPYLREAWRIGLESGNLVSASFSAFHIILQRLARGDQLESVADECQKYMDLLRGFNDEHHYQALVASLQMIRILEKPWNGAVQWNDESFDKSTFLENLQKKLYISAIIHFFNARVRVAYLLGEFKEALAVSREVERYAAFTWGYPFQAEQWFYAALSRSALWEETPDSERSHLLLEVAAYKDKLEKLAISCPKNFQPRYLLVAAEAARLGERNDQAMDFYDEAIDVARRYEFSDLEALAFELAGRFFLGRKKERIARVYIRDACFRYAQWGARAKVSQMQQHHSYLIDLEEYERASTATSTTSAGHSNSLDLASFMKASRAISSEMKLGPLLEKLLHIALENAGAEKGFLILEKRERLYVEAEGLADRDPVTLLNIGPMGPHIRLSSAIVNYVYHTGQHVVLGNAAKEGLFTSDPYVFRQRPRSLLCLPLIAQGKTIGVLYLENNLVSDAFTNDRLEILQLITSEASISIENARLYTNLDDTSKWLQQSNQKLEEQNRTLEIKVNERTRELQEKNGVLEQTLSQLQTMQKQIIQQEKLASLGTLTAGIAHEIRNPLNFVNNFSELSRDLLTDLVEELDPLKEAHLKGEQRDWVDQLISDLENNLERIREHGQRADAVVHSMLRHSYDKTVTMPEAADLNQLFDEYLMLSYHGIRARDATFTMEIEKDYDLYMEPMDVVSQDLSRVVINLVENACFSIHKKQKELGNTFQGLLKITTKDRGEEVEIRVWDNGLGIPKEVRDKVFNPFFTTKPAGEGTGLGLSITNEIIVNGHGGHLTVDSEEGQWTEFVICLPKHPKFDPKP